MRGKMIGPLALLCVFAFAQDFQGQVKYLPDHIGKVHRLVWRDPGADYQLSAGETDAVTQTLKRVEQFLAAQPTLNPPRGCDILGDVEIRESSLCLQHPCRNVPVASELVMNFHHWMERDGKLIRGPSDDHGVIVYINDPASPMLHNVFSATVDTFRDFAGPPVLTQPNRLGEIHGLTLWGFSDRGTDFLVLARSPKPLFVPLTQEVYLQMLIRVWEKAEGDLAQGSQGPTADAYRNWLAERGQRQKAYQDISQQMKKTDPQKAEQYLRDMEKTEREVDERLRKDTEKNPPKASPPLQILSQLKAMQATMPAAKRQAQARYTTDLASLDDPKGWPLVTVNPEIIDRGLPRSAVQLIEVFFICDPPWIASKDPDDASGRGVYEMEQTSNWAALQQLLAK